MVDETEMVDDPETEGLIFSTKSRKIIKQNYVNYNFKLYLYFGVKARKDRNTV